MRYPIHSQFLFAASDKGGGGGGADPIAEAIAQMGDIPRIPGKTAQDPKNQDRQDTREVEDDKKKVGDKHDNDEDGDDDDPEDKSKSVIGDAIRKTIDGNKDGKDDKKGDDKKADDKKPSDTYDKDLGDFDPNDRGRNIGDKFKRLKSEAITKLRDKDKLLADHEAKIKELEAKKPEFDPAQLETHPEVVKLRTALKEREELIERKWLEEAPSFKREFQEKINTQTEVVVKTLKTVTDEKHRVALGQAVDTLMRLPLDDDGEARFDQGLGELMEKSGLNVIQQNKVMTAMQDIRATMVAKEGKITNWKESSKEFGAKEQAAKQTQVKATLNALEAARTTYHNGLAEKIGFFKKNENVFQYDAITGPLFDKAKEAISKTAETGVPTTDAINLIHAGVDMPFYFKLAETFEDAFKRERAEHQKTKEELDKLRGKDPSRGSRDNGRRKETLDGKKDEEGEEDKGSRSVLGAALKRKMATA